MIFEKEIVINGKALTRKYVESLNKEQREELINPIFLYFRNQGFIYPDNIEKLNKEYKRLYDAEIDLKAKELFNNSNIGTYICKHFCKSFYLATEPGKKNMVELFNDNDCLKKVIKNRLGLDWFQKHGPDDIEAFPISPRQILQGFRSSRQVPMITMFKPIIARYVYEKYSNVGDVVYDFSAGFGARLLGARNRKYIGVDPLTAGEIGEIRDCFGLSGEIYDEISENFCLNKNSIDLAFSSPPYFNQEEYSRDDRQAYNKGEDYFYNVYWKKTLANIYHMLKDEKFFILNVKNRPQMVEMAKEKFGLMDEIYLRTIRSHLNKKAGIEKKESMYVFKKI